jgi:hypothetical protein
LRACWTAAAGRSPTSGGVVKAMCTGTVVEHQLHCYNDQFSASGRMLLFT